MGAIRPCRRSFPTQLTLLTLFFALMGSTLSACDRNREAEALCRDTVNALADAWDRCGYDREAKHAEVLGGLRSCEDVERVRDADALVSQCFPALATLDCTDLVEDALPEACMEQILF